jgi:hypothetical protein
MFVLTPVWHATILFLLPLNYQSQLIFTPTMSNTTPPADTGGDATTLQLVCSPKIPYALLTGHIKSSTPVINTGPVEKTKGRTRAIFVLDRSGSMAGAP